MLLQYILFFDTMYRQIKGKIMRVVTLASGSKGNCTYVETAQAKILVDAGLTLKNLELRLSVIDVNPNNNDFFEDDFKINDLAISSFEVSHDVTHCVGFNLYNEGKKISIATDLGHTNSNIIDKLKNSTLVILEANHDVEALKANTKYPIYLKNRILSNRGHLSNLSASEVIAELVNYNVQQIVLAHLSEENNTPQMAYNTVKEFLARYEIIEGKNIFIDVAHQHKIGKIFNLK